ncbi:class I SAM-dependent methyltransferase [Helicobacter enhydrae]|uniref:class I SAM-dependent methyltransferase n=1 Tax=Helicobacter enhydrae TaxID=222136 RepID=UPI001901D534|nr:methyltransferase domain-containing protein [Helicobacter enhydrae]
MLEDAIKWNAKHLQNPMPQTPSDLLVAFLPKFLDSLPSHNAIDIACGNGRNSKFLAQHGLICDSLDISEVALANLENIKNINALCVDLDTYTPTSDTYGLALNFYFLNRNLFPSIIQSLKSGGVLMLETFVKEEDGSNDSEIPDEKILNHNELEHIFADFTIHHSATSYIRRKENQRAKIISFIAQKH